MLSRSLVVVTGLLAAIDLLASAAPLYAAGRSGVDSLQNRRREYPLNCRGGGGLAFDTLGPPAGPKGSAGLSLSFSPNPTASGPEGQGLQPGTCAWVDRPVNDVEPRQLRFTTAVGDSILRLTVHDSSQYWGFLAFNSDSGHFTGVGHRHWATAWLPTAAADLPRASTLDRGGWLPFSLRHLHWLVLAWMLISWIPFMMLAGVWSGWRRLASLYSERPAGRGRSRRHTGMVMGMANYRGGVRLAADDSHLHFSMTALLRPGHPPFSVPWSDITIARDEWPWFPFKGHPVTRITLARHRSLRVLVPESTGDLIITASENRLHLTGSRVAAATAT